MNRERDREKIIDNCKTCKYDRFCNPARKAEFQHSKDCPFYWDGDKKGDNPLCPHCGQVHKGIDNCIGNII